MVRGPSGTFSGTQREGQRGECMVAFTWRFEDEQEDEDE